MSTATLDMPRPSLRVKQRVQPRYRKPLLVGLATAAFASLTVSNGVFIDESLYVLTGEAYLDNALHGTPIPEGVGDGLSGLPHFYPVIASLLDRLGGITAVRLFSALCIVATAFILRSITRRVFDQRAGMIAAVSFALAAPVLLVANLGTFDAFAMLLLAAALWMATARKSIESGATVGLLLALAVMAKYTTAVFVPAIIGTMFIVRPYAWHYRHTYLRAALALGVVVGWAGGVWALARDQISDDIAFTTTNRAALSPVDPSVLVERIPYMMAPWLIAGVLGVAFLVRARHFRLALWTGGLALTAMALPIAQLRLGEAVSFEKHMAYTALFLAPVVGWGLARPWRNVAWVGPLCVIMASMAVWGGFRLHDVYSWPDVRPVAAALPNVEGTYISSSADSLKYYQRDVEWDTTFQLYAEGDAGIRQAVEDGRYAVVAIREGATGSTIQDAGQKTFLSALDADEDYRLEEVKTSATETWLIYTRQPPKVVGPRTQS